MWSIPYGVITLCILHRVHFTLNCLSLKSKWRKKSEANVQKEFFIPDRASIKLKSKNNLSLLCSTNFILANLLEPSVTSIRLSGYNLDDKPSLKINLKLNFSWTNANKWQMFFIDKLNFLQFHKRYKGSIINDVIYTFWKASTP